MLAANLHHLLRHLHRRHRVHVVRKHHGLVHPRLHVILLVVRHLISGLTPRQSLPRCILIFLVIKRAPRHALQNRIVVPDALPRSLTSVILIRVRHPQRRRPSFPTIRTQRIPSPLLPVHAVRDEIRLFVHDSFILLSHLAARHSIHLHVLLQLVQIHRVILRVQSLVLNRSGGDVETDLLRRVLVLRLDPRAALGVAVVRFNFFGRPLLLRNLHRDLRRVVLARGHRVVVRVAGIGVGVLALDFLHARRHFGSRASTRRDLKRRRRVRHWTTRADRAPTARRPRAR